MFFVQSVLHREATLYRQDSGLECPVQPCSSPHLMYHVSLITCMYVCREGIFVRVLGHIRTFSQQRSVVGFLIQPLKDFNEITYHMVHVVHSQLALQKGAPVVRGGEGRGGERRGG